MEKEVDNNCLEERAGIEDLEGMQANQSLVLHATYQDAMNMKPWDFVRKYQEIVRSYNETPLFGKLDVLINTAEQLMIDVPVFTYRRIFEEGFVE